MSDAHDIDVKRQRDFDDLQHEIRGDDNGRMQRFLHPEDDRTPEGKRKKREEVRRAFERLMRDPDYARLYGVLGDRLGNAEAHADATLDEIQRRLDQVERESLQLEDRAARAPNGRLVFQFADGRVVYADGSDVAPEIAEGIIWPEDAPLAETYFAVKAQEHALKERAEDWTAYRYGVLGRIRDRYDDQADPMSKEDLKEALAEIERLRPELATKDVPRAFADPQAPAATMAMPTTLN